MSAFLARRNGTLKNDEFAAEYSSCSPANRIQIESSRTYRRSRHRMQLWSDSYTFARTSRVEGVVARLSRMRGTLLTSYAADQISPCRKGHCFSRPRSTCRSPSRRLDVPVGRVSLPCALSCCLFELHSFPRTDEGTHGESKLCVLEALRLKVDVTTIMMPIVSFALSYRRVASAYQRPEAPNYRFHICFQAIS
jgi:hypothetical protein